MNRNHLPTTLLCLTALGGLGFLPSCADVTADPDAAIFDAANTGGNATIDDDMNAAAGGSLSVSAGTGGLVGSGGMGGMPAMGSGGMPTMSSGGTDTGPEVDCDDDAQCAALPGCQTCEYTGIKFVCQPDPGQTECGGSCIDTASDNNNCGECDKQCSSGATCQASECVCDMGATDCSGECVDLTSDPNNCNECGKKCEGDTPYCVEGGCSACPNVGEEVCEMSCVDTQTDASNCGDCGKACVGDQICQGGGCTCENGGELCNDVCTDTQTSAQHCGGCNAPCGNGENCIDGSCGTGPCFGHPDLSSYGSLNVNSAGTLCEGSFGSTDWVHDGALWECTQWLTAPPPGTGWRKIADCN